MPFAEKPKTSARESMANFKSAVKRFLKKKKQPRQPRQPKSQ